MKWLAVVRDWLIKKLGGYTSSEYSQEHLRRVNSENDGLRLSQELTEAQHACNYAESKWMETEKKLRDAEVNPHYTYSIRQIENKDFSVSAAITYPECESKEHISRILRYALESLVEKLLPLAAIYYHYDPRLMTKNYTIRLNVNDIHSLSCMPEGEEVLSDDSLR